MSQSVVSLDARKKKLIALGGGGALLLGLVAAPFVLMAIGGLVGLIVAGILGFGAITFAPVVGMKFANWRLKAIKTEATANPIETLQGVKLAKEQALAGFARQLEAFRTEVLNFKSTSDSFRAKYPNAPDKFGPQLVKYETLLTARKKAYAQAVSDLKSFQAVIDQAEAEWAVAQAALRAGKASGMDTGDLFEKIKTDTSLNAVQQAMNGSFAQLETLLLDEVPSEEPLVLEHVSPSGNQVYIPASPVKEKVR